MLDNVTTYPLVFSVFIPLVIWVGFAWVLVRLRLIGTPAAYWLFSRSSLVIPFTVGLVAVAQARHPLLLATLVPSFVMGLVCLTVCELNQRSLAAFTRPLFLPAPGRWWQKGTAWWPRVWDEEAPR